MARFGVDLGCRLGMGGSVVSQCPMPRQPSGWGARGELVWWEGVVVLTLGPACLPASPSPPYSFPLLLHLLLCSLWGPISGLNMAQWASRLVLIE